VSGSINRSCAECSGSLHHENVSGLCNACYTEARIQQKLSLDQQIIAAVKGGATRAEVAQDLGLKLSRVYSAASIVPRHIPARRLADIIAVAAAYASLEVDEVTGPKHTHTFVRARQAVCLIGMRAGYSSTQIAQALGGRHHASILHGRDTAAARAEADHEYAAYLTLVDAGEMPEPPSEPDPIACEAEIAEPGAVDLSIPFTPCRKRRNDFTCGIDDDEDDGHRFQQSIAAGSQALRAAIMLARAA
jgi:hypothetical protein